MLLFSLVVFLLFIGVTAWTGYQVATVSYRKVANYFKPRTGIEMYTALLGKPTEGCLQVLNSKDQYVPGMDCCIWLQVRTCPAEVKRVIQQQPYETSIRATANLMESFDAEKPHWWKPQELSDSILVMNYSNQTEDRIQTWYLSKDSLQAFYVDILY